MSEANKAASMKLAEMFGGADTSVAGQYIAENAVDHQGVPGLDTNGVEGFQRMVAFYRSAFPDMKAEVMAVIAEGDLVTMQFHMTGTNTGVFMGMPATGKKIDIEGVDIMRFQDGKAVEHWGYLEEAKFMQQLGLMPGA